MNVVGIRLKNVRSGMGLSLRKFAKIVGEDFTLLDRIEAGKRFPPKTRIGKFANLLSLTQLQLEALVAVERRGLNPYEMLPEIAPAYISHQIIESEAGRILAEYNRVFQKSTIECPVPIVKIIKTVCGLSIRFLDFLKARIPSPSADDLYGCLFPDGFRGKDKLVLINTGRIDGRRLSHAERMITVAHEAGHYLLHCGNKESAQLFFRFSKNPSFCRVAKFKSTPWNAHEDQANAFAACILMPRQNFLNMWHEESGDWARLASHFDVTDSFVRFRANMLRL